MIDSERGSDARGENGSSPATQEEPTRVQVQFAEGIDYRYRDVLNIFVGRGEVVFELGNIHRSVPNQATISDRIVVSMANAYDFHARLGQSLKEAQQALQKEMAQTKA
ncbi:MAG: hypothetical protein LAT65_07185 [Saccharospirillum sp.]|nr:hypothetical protein [Saccharospirillum sp.]